MFSFQSSVIGTGNTIKFTVFEESVIISYLKVIQYWSDHSEFRTWFSSLLADVPFQAFRWETPPLVREKMQRDFECVVMDDPALNRTPDPNAFAEQFKKKAGSQSVIEFANLGGDVVMVVPCPVDEQSNYCHLAAFLRTASDEQKHELWKSVGAAMQRRIGEQPVWLSTAGAGVAWLHVRLDDRPKYYGHRPYRNA